MVCLAALHRPWTVPGRNSCLPLDFHSGKIVYKGKDRRKESGAMRNVRNRDRPSAGSRLLLRSIYHECPFFVGKIQNGNKLCGEMIVLCAILWVLGRT